MTKVDKLFVVAADQLKGTVANTMQSSEADESSIASVRSFSNAIPFRWEETQLYCKQALQSTAWERYIDWYERCDKKRKPEPKGKEGDSEVSINVPDTPPPAVSQTATSQVSGSVPSSIPGQLASMSPPITPEKLKKTKKSKAEHVC
jgi:hypothetical protein